MKMGRMKVGRMKVGLLVAASLLLAAAAPADEPLIIENGVRAAPAPEPMPAPPPPPLPEKTAEPAPQPSAAASPGHQPTPAELCGKGRLFFCDSMNFAIHRAGRRRSLVLQGGIGAGDTERFRAALEQAGPIDEIMLDSPGGVLEEGLAIGRIVRARKLTTHVPNGFACISACNFVFMGGVVRYVDPGGVFMVHMFTASGSEDFIADIATETREKGLPSTVRAIEQEAAETAAKVARYLVEMSVSLRFLTEFAAIPNANPRRLNADELRQYNLVNTD